MRNLQIAVVLCLGFLPRLAAQVSVEIVLDQDQFLPRESMRVGVRITNFSGQTLRFGTDNDWLRFTVESESGNLIPQQCDIPVRGEFDVESSTVATKRVDIAPCIHLIRPGRYRVAAAVRIKQWEKELVTKPVTFSVVAGTRLWEQDFGVPNPAGGNSLPEVRRYALQQAMHMKQMKLYVRVTDQTESRFFGVFPLGPMVSFSVPEHQIDKTNNLHVLCQIGPRAFNYSVINPDGQLVIRQTHDYTDTRPVLRASPDGRVLVAGGVRRIALDDIPPPVQPAALTNDVAKVKP